MLTKKKKILITVGTLVPIVGASIGLLVYYNVNKNKEVNLADGLMSQGANQVQEPNTIYDNMDIFPKLTTSDFYKYIRFENGHHVIDNDFIAAVINYVVSNMKVVGGSVHYKYDQSAPSSLNITFYWSKSNTKEYWRTYSINLTT